MTLALRPSRDCLALVQRFEGFRPGAARLAGGGWTIGYGHTAGAREGAQASEADAEALLTWDLDRAGAVVREATFAPLNQNQFDALTAFTFNIGADRFRGSTVLRRVNAGDTLGAATALEAWRNAEFEGAPQVIDGLVRRRAAEKALFLTPPEGFRFVPTGVLRPQPDGGLDDGDALPGRMAAAPPTETTAHAAEVHAPMRGDHAVVERVPAAEGLAEPSVAPEPVAPAPVTAAADAVSSRLQRLFPESDGAPPRSAAELVEHAPPAPPLSHDAPPELAPELAVAPPEPPPPPFPGAAAVFPHAEAPPPLPPAPMIGADDPFIEAVPAGPAPARPATGRTRAPVAVAPERFAEEARGRAGPGRSRLYFLIGALGLLMFAAAIAWMLRGRADTFNLLLGLAGVILMAPAGAALVLPWLNRGAPDRG